ncbi:uncharacterized protein LOC121743997 isoform X1 [Salvia splendens]|uniref:uncharacterized protein LOC121743997 isoform X1 n=1 Tax=Salvia splendens TaxID=180675 RepID=UPI001C26BD2D|nr:uncharacterized protein LOC121743997 isoform X1 [Salvia splendens]
MSLDEGLVRLFDNISLMEMAELGVQRGIVDVYALHENDVLVSQLTQELGLSDVGTGAADAVSVGSVDVGASNARYVDVRAGNVGDDDFDIWIGDGAEGDRRGGDVPGDTLIIFDVEDDVQAEQEKARAIRKAKVKAKVGGRCCPVRL